MNTTFVDFLTNPQQLVRFAGEQLADWMKRNGPSQVDTARLMLELLKTLPKREQPSELPTVASMRSAVNRIVNGQAKRLEPYQVKVISLLIPSLFDQFTLPAQCPITASPATALRVEYNRNTKLEDRLSGKYASARFRVVSSPDARMPVSAAAADWLQDEVDTCLAKSEGLFAIAVSGGPLQSTIARHVRYRAKPRSKSECPFVVQSLNDVHWIHRVEYSADWVALALAKRLRGAAMAVPYVQGDLWRLNKEMAVRCEICVLGCGDRASGFVSEWLNQEKVRLPRQLVGDIAYHPIDATGAHVATANVAAALQPFRIMSSIGKIAALSRKGAAVMVAAYQSCKVDVIRAILAGQLANRLVLSSGLAEQL